MRVYLNKIVEYTHISARKTIRHTANTFVAPFSRMEGFYIVTKPAPPPTHSFRTESPW